MSQSTDVPPKVTKTRASTSTPAEDVMPVAGAIEIEPKKSKKPKYSKELKDFQKWERGMSRANHRMSRAVEGAMRTWRKEEKKSSKRRKDGAIRDGLENSVRAMTSFAREASWAPMDFIKVVQPKVRPVRVLAGMISPFIP